MHETDRVATAIIGMPGQIYCPSCVNENGIFVELNNGAPSGGGHPAFERKSLLINLLEYLQNAGTFKQLERQLLATQSDYSLIVNTATHNRTQSFEYSATLGQETYYPDSSDYFVSTNFYQSDLWSNIPTPIDAETWYGVTRRNNLLRLLAQQQQHDANSIKDIMEEKIENGGGLWNYTIYQLVLDTNTMMLYTRSIKTQDAWDQTALFDEDDSDTSNKKGIGSAEIASIGAAATFFALVSAAYLYCYHTTDKEDKQLAQQQLLNNNKTKKKGRHNSSSMFTDTPGCELVPVVTTTRAGESGSAAEARL